MQYCSPKPHPLVGERLGIKLWVMSIHLRWATSPSQQHRVWFHCLRLTVALARPWQQQSTQVPQVPPDVPQTCVIFMFICRSPSSFFRVCTVNPSTSASPVAKVVMVPAVSLHTVACVVTVATEMNTCWVTSYLKGQKSFESELFSYCSKTDWSNWKCKPVSFSWSKKKLHVERFWVEKWAILARPFL